jgi:hypothetical protein
MQTNYQYCSVTLPFLDSVILSNTKLNNSLSIIIISFQFKYKLRVMNAAGCHEELKSYCSCDEHCCIC